MPQINGYSIYVAPNDKALWTVRVYRDGDDTHIHSAERATLDVGLTEASRAVMRDLNRPDERDIARGEELAEAQGWE